MSLVVFSWLAGAVVQEDTAGHPTLRRESLGANPGALFYVVDSNLAPVALSSLVFVYQACVARPIGNFGTSMG